jgi:hypothetical protein
MLESGVHRFVAELSRETGMFLKQEAFDSSSPTLLTVHSSVAKGSLSRIEPSSR